jgi:hypothetical protein
MRRRVAAALGLAALVTGVVAAPASATFHEVSIRELYPGSVAAPDAEYVELQMWSPGQNFVDGHSLKTYAAGGALVKTTVVGADVPRGENQRTILLATPAAEAAFGVDADAAMAPNQMDPAVGAVCWEALDCVSWGGFSGSLPSPAGSPAAPDGIADGMALRRTIAPGCPTELEPTDDSDNSGADLSPVFPSPRPNSVAPSEHACASAGGPQKGSGGARRAVQTRLRRRPGHRTRDRTPTFGFGASEPGAGFECKLDRTAFRRCRSPFTAKRLRAGRHTFKVRARDDSGRADPTPARWTFRVVAERR